MRRTLTALALGALMLAPPLTSSAAADGYHGGDWTFGAGFRVGDFHFALGYAAPSYGHAPVYYYRSSPRLAYRGHRCHDRCFRHQSYAYHHRECPLVSHHFGRYRVEPRLVLARYAPDYGYYYRSHSGQGRHDRYDHDRYDRRTDRRHDRDDDRYDRRGRDRDRDDRDRHRGRRGHDHRDHRGKSCPYDR